MARVLKKLSTRLEAAQQASAGGSSAEKKRTAKAKQAAIIELNKKIGEGRKDEKYAKLKKMSSISANADDATTSHASGSGMPVDAHI